MKYDKKGKYFMKNRRYGINANTSCMIVLFIALQISATTKTPQMPAPKNAPQNQPLAAINDKITKLSENVTNLTNTVEKLKKDVRNLSKKTSEQKKSPQLPEQKANLTPEEEANLSSPL